MQRREIANDLPVNATREQTLSFGDRGWNSGKSRKKVVKAQYLSLGGRVILINTVLDSLPTYVMSLFPTPSKVVKKLDRLRRNFL